MRTIEKMERAFTKYQILSQRAESFVRNRNQGNFGIAVADDYNAKEWQKLKFRIHFLECYLTGRQINWYYASWLTNDEAQRRNDDQKLNVGE